MAKAVYHKNQRVYVKPVGTWALIERVLPQWAKGLDEPIRIYYDVGLGREFGAEELVAEGGTQDHQEIPGESWRIVRSRNKWQAAEDCSHHPFPGTYPTIVTQSRDWGGWRVPGAEYDLDPFRIELQARIMVNGPRFVKLISELIAFSENDGEDLPFELKEILDEAKAILRYVHEENSSDVAEINEPEDEGHARSPSAIAS